MAERWDIGDSSECWVDICSAAIRSALNWPNVNVSDMSYLDWTVSLNVSREYYSARSLRLI